MGQPRSWAKIEFPERLIDAEIREKLVEDYGAEFNDAGVLEDWNSVDIDPGEFDGIFILEDSEAVCGEFEGLEAMLKLKGIPFDRETAMDWQQPPCRQVYRPARNGQAEIDEHIQLNSDGEVVVSVAAIREFLSIDDAGEMAASEIRRFLDDHFPAYPPLSDWVKEA